MNSLAVIALGGAGGAVLRFLVATGTYQWLGRGFPYGTLMVNVVGSFLMGLLSQTLFLQRVFLSTEYRSAILVGFLGAFTTFSTFSLETVTLLVQGEVHKAGLNVLVSVVSCLLAVWIGGLIGRELALNSHTVFFASSGLLLLNTFGAVFMAFLACVLMNKSSLSIEYQVSIAVILMGAFITLSSLYLLLALFEQGYGVDKNIKLIAGAFIINSMLSLFAMVFGAWLSRKI